MYATNWPNDTKSSSLATPTRLCCVCDALGSCSQAPGPSFHSLPEPHVRGQGSVFLWGSSDVCPDAICLTKSLHMLVFVRGLKRRLSKTWIMIELIFTIICILWYPFFFCSKTISVPVMHLMRGRRSVARKVAHGLEFPIMKYCDSPKTFKCPCVRWKECKINFGIWGIFFKPTSSLGLSRAGSQGSDSLERIQIAFPSVNCHSHRQRKIIVLHAMFCF